jgi:beta-glucosidase
LKSPILDKALEVKNGKIGIASAYLRLITASLVLAGCAVAPAFREHHPVTRTVPSASSESELSDWPRIASAIAPDPAMEARIQEIVAGMTVTQKVGQMTQTDISAATPEDVRRYYLGGILNGADSQPFGVRFATFAQWRELTAQYHAAALATNMSIKIPLIWGTDAVHGHGIVRGASIFPHNIGLGAAHDPELIAAIGAVVGAQVRATGIDWVFAPTLAVVQNYRWGRSYESYSSDPALVREYAAAYVKGLQGTFANDANAVATAKHFIGDGGTNDGVDRGVNLSNHMQMIEVHAQGYVGAIGAGVQTVMASYNSWNDLADGRDYGKMHGAKSLLTDVLKDRMGFDGFIISDWNGIAEVPGCKPDSCARSINAGIDMVMVPEKWKRFIANTVAQVRHGEIPMSRIDDAVTRILRVKMRAGLFDREPDQFSGGESTLQARPLARRAVRESLVLLKNNDAALPLARNKRILVVGKSADSLRNQAGGWSLDWQGTKNRNADFPAGDTILAGIREAAGDANVVYSETAENVAPGDFDAIIAVVGEGPYAEMKGDITGIKSLALSSRYPEDYAVLRKVSGHGKPVITVLVSGRPVYANDLLNLSDAFVAAWLPGTEGKGVADVLFADAPGASHHDFHGSLPFAWPRMPCQASFDGSVEPLFGRGYGLTYANSHRVAALETPSIADNCAARNAAAPNYR